MSVNYIPQNNPQNNILDSIESLLNEIEENTSPEPLPVIVSTAKCPVHGFKYISYPREQGADSNGYIQKCPLKACGAGI